MYAALRERFSITLAAQWRALELIGENRPAAPTESERVQALVAAASSKANWPGDFAKPRVKLPDVGDYLSESRSQAAERWLLLQRKAHAEAVRAPSGVMGSSLGNSWPFDDVPSPSEAPGEHTVPVEWYSPGAALILENRDGRQCPVGIHIALQSENSSKGSKPLGTFSLSMEGRDSKRMYVAPSLPDAKRAQLAKSCAFSFVAYLGLSNKQTSKGSAPLAASTGVAAYARAWQQHGEFKRLVQMPPTAWERRIQLLCLGLHWQVGNPFVTHDGVLTDDLAALLGSRFRGDDPLYKLCDDAVRDSVLRAPR